MAPARHLIRRAADQMLENSARGQPGGVPRISNVHLGIDDFLGADPGEVEVEDLLAKMVPLHVADQHGLGRAVHVQIGKVAGSFEHPPDIIARKRHGHDRLLMPINHRRYKPLSSAVAWQRGCPSLCSSPGPAARPVFSSVPPSLFSSPTQKEKCGPLGRTAEGTYYADSVCFQQDRRSV